MEGTMKVTYALLCDNDFEREVSVKELLEDEKILKVLKSAFAASARNVEVTPLCEKAFVIKTQRIEYSFEIPKDDFAEALTLAEEDARKHKRFKKGCERLMLIDIETY
ncbi:MAG: hypothetical protein PHW64_03230 [Sulfuricurvum sp.]|nr:hypothetical protein [Sulfuricurvum sp.]